MMPRFEYHLPVEAEYPMLKRLLQRGPPGKREEIALARRARSGDQEARWELVLGHARFAYFMARRWHRKDRSVTIEDLVQVALLAMYRLTRAFDPQLSSFPHYTVRYIRRALKKEYADFGRALSIPYHVRGTQHRALCEYGSWDAVLKLTARKLADVLDINIATARAVQWLTFGELGLDAPDIYGERVNGETAVDAQDGDLRVELIANDDADLLRRLLATLPAKDRTILAHRWGVLGKEYLTRRQLGERYQVTRNSISHIENRALRGIRRHIAHGIIEQSEDPMLKAS